MPRWAPYLLFLKDFWVTTAQVRNRNAVALTQSPVSKNSSYSLCLKRNRDTADTLEVKFHPCPFFITYKAVHAPLQLKSPAHDPGTEDQLSWVQAQPYTTRLQCALPSFASYSEWKLRPILDGWMDILEAQQ